MMNNSRPREWGFFTPIRDAIARASAGSAAPPAAAPRYECVIVKVDALGDFVLALGAIRRLIAAFGRTKCALVVSPAAAALAQLEFSDVMCKIVPAHVQNLFRDILPQLPAWRKELAELSTRHVVVLRHQRSLYRDMLARAVPAHERWWLKEAPYSDRGILELPPACALYPRLASAPTELAAHAMLVTSVLRVPVAAQELIPVLTPVVPSGDPHVMIAPCAQHLIRDLPAELTWSALQRANLDPGLPIRLIGTEAQRPRLERQRTAAPTSWRARVAVVTDLPLARWLNEMAAAQLVLSADSATAHLATALDRPMVALLGGGHPRLLAPWARSARQCWVHEEIACSGCDWRCVHPEPYCLTRLHHEAIAAAIARVTRPL